jgi:hypothetical protein
MNYIVHDMIAEIDASIEKWDTDADYQRQMKDLGMRRPTKMDRHADTYPQKESYTFQEFASACFEMGGYGDMTICDPYTLKRLWVSQDELRDLSIYDAMRRVIAIAEQVDFLNESEAETEDSCDTHSEFHCPSFDTTPDGPCETVRYREPTDAEEAADEATWD